MRPLLVYAGSSACVNTCLFLALLLAKKGVYGPGQFEFYGIVYSIPPSKKGTMKRNKQCETVGQSAGVANCVCLYSIYLTESTPCRLLVNNALNLSNIEADV